MKEKLKKALKQTQFEELQKMEKNDGFKEKNYKENFFSQTKKFFLEKEKLVHGKMNYQCRFIKKIEKIF